MSEPQYYIWASDPHGTGQPWIDLVTQAQHDYSNSETIFGGDYIDGNKYANKTVNFVMDQVKNHHATALLGNHEQLMYDFVEHNEDLWYQNGAKTTIKSFFSRGFSKSQTRQHLRSDPRYIFLINLPKIITRPRFIFVHAGIACWNQHYLNHDTYNDLAPLFSMMDSQDYFYLWSREDYWYGKNEDPIFAHNITHRTIVTGHTPTMFVQGSVNDDYIGPTYDYTDEPKHDKDLPNRPCPVVKVQYPNESPRYFTDGGCHANNNHHGNVCVFSADTGNLVKTYNSDTDIIPYIYHEN